MTAAASSVGWDARNAAQILSPTVAMGMERKSNAPEAILAGLTLA